MYMKVFGFSLFCLRKGLSVLPDWPRACCVDQADLDTSDHPTSRSAEFKGIHHHPGDDFILNSYQAQKNNNFCCGELFFSPNIKSFSLS